MVEINLYVVALAFALGAAVGWRLAARKTGAGKREPEADFMALMDVLLNHLHQEKAPRHRKGRGKKGK